MRSGSGPMRRAAWLAGCAGLALGTAMMANGALAQESAQGTSVPQGLPHIAASGTPEGGEAGMPRDPATTGALATGPRQDAAEDALETLEAARESQDPAAPAAPMPAASTPAASTPAASAPVAPVAAELPAFTVPLPALPDAQSGIVATARAEAMARAVRAHLASPAFPWPKRLPKRERELIALAYGAQGDAPLWIEGEGWNKAGLSIAGRLARVAEDGLDPDAYVPPSERIKAGADRSAALAEADISLTALAVLYARDARGGRLNLAGLSKLVTPKLDLPPAGDVVAKLRAAQEPGDALVAYNPPQPGYVALKAKLAEVRAAQPALVSHTRIPAGPPLSIGMRDVRVPLVRARFGLGPTAERSTVYDTRLASAVADFQKQNGLPASGVLNRETTLALGGAAARLPREADILVNMERWRWLPADLGQRHVIVNIPEYTLRLMDHGNVVHQARVIVGKADSATPIFSHEMEYAVVNPSWHVPPSILKNEFLPALAQNPNYAAERGYIVERRGNTISVRQPPGERNALGFIKFMFPNQHAVYIHDTPSRNLFGATRRALSHGCVRVEQPFRLADFVFDGEWDEKRLKSLIGKGERTIRLKAPLPVHLTYFTLSVDAAGRVDARDDIYGIDAKLRVALGLRG